MNKSATKSKLKLDHRLNFTLVSFAALVLGACEAHAQTLTFDGSGANNATQTGNWTTATTTTDWNTAADGSATPNTYWTNGDDAHFSVSGSTTPTTASTVTLTSAISANSLVFDTGATTINGAFGLTVGVGGITVNNSLNSSVSPSANSATEGIITTVAQTWANNGTGIFTDLSGSIGGGTTQGAGVTVTAGIFALGGNSDSVMGTGSFTINGGQINLSATTAGEQSHNFYLVSGTLNDTNQKSASNITTFLEGNFTFAGTGSSTYGIASLALDTNSTITTAASSFTVINVIKNGTSGTTLTLAGPTTGTTAGQLALNGTSTFTNTTVTVGALSVLSFGAGSTGGDINTGAGTGFTGGTISNSGTVAFNHSGAYTFNGHITGVGGVTNVAGTNTLTDGTSDYTGVTTVSGGTLSATTLSNGGFASSIGAASNVAANIVLSGGALQYSGTTAASTDRLFTIGGAYAATLDSSGTGAINFTNTGSIGTQNHAESLTLTGTNSGNNILAAKIAGGSVSNATTLYKTGAGTWTLTNANTYNGTTNISAGTLIVNGSDIATSTSTVSAYNVTAQATLGGTSASGATTAGINTGASAINIGNGTTGGTITGGAVGTVGMLTLTTTNASGVVFNGASGSLSTYAVDISSDGTTSDNLKINGALTLTGSYDHIMVTGTPTVSSLDLINYTGSLTGSFTEVSGDLPAGYTLAYNTGEIDLVTTSVPEPSTWAAGCLSLGTAGWALQKRRRAAKLNRPKSKAA